MSDRDDIRRLAQILDKFMVGMLNNLTGIISTLPDSLHVQALDELHEFLAEAEAPVSEQPSVKLVVHIPCPHGHLDRHRACDPEKLHSMRDSCWCPGARYREIDPDEVLPFRAPVGRYRVTGADVLEAVRRLDGLA